MKYLNKIKIETKKLVYYFFILFIVFCLASLFFVYYFLYKNFYLSIIKVDEIVILKDKVAIESLNIAKFNNVIKKINEKTANKDFEKIKNPFN